MNKRNLLTAAITIIAVIIIAVAIIQNSKTPNATRSRESDKNNNTVLKTTLSQPDSTDKSADKPAVTDSVSAGNESSKQVEFERTVIVTGQLKDENRNPFVPHVSDYKDEDLNDQEDSVISYMVFATVDKNSGSNAKSLSEIMRQTSIQHTALTDENGSFKIEFRYNTSSKNSDTLYVSLHPTGTLYKNRGVDRGPGLQAVKDVMGPLFPFYCENSTFILKKQVEELTASFTLASKANLTVEITPARIPNEHMLLIMNGKNGVAASNIEFASIGLYSEKATISLPARTNLELTLSRSGYEDYKEILSPLSIGEERLLSINMAKSSLDFTGQILDWDETPLKKTNVSIVQGATYSNAETDDSGNFIIKGIKKSPITRITLNVWERNIAYKKYWFENVDAEKPFNIRLEKAGPVSISGKCLDKDGKPYASVSVTIYQDGLEVPVNISSNNNGEFSAQGLLDKTISKIEFHYYKSWNNPLTIDDGTVVMVPEGGRLELTNVDPQTFITVTLK
ncbi:MAG: hypothetical protein HY606_15305 [Planctomycetes bacterium]|nr:hypothetical protein [Planctomycetota bacterium]